MLTSDVLGAEVVPAATDSCSATDSCGPAQQQQQHSAAAKPGIADDTSLLSVHLAKKPLRKEAAALSQHEPHHVRCTHSSTRCAGNQCCPRAEQTGDKTYPCPSADEDFDGCEFHSPRSSPTTTAAATTSPSSSPPGASEVTVSTVSFSPDYNDCSDTRVSTGSGFFQYVDANKAIGGRIVSDNGYKGLETLTFELDFTGLTSSNQWALFKNAAIYLISRPDGQQPSGSNYCDQGGNLCDDDCLEIDIMESFGPIGFQTTIHTTESGGSDVCGNKQAGGFWYVEEMWNNLSEIGCSTYTLPTGDGTTPTQTWDPLTTTATVLVTLGDSAMTVDLTVGSVTKRVFDSSATLAAFSSTTFDYSKVVDYNTNYGYWVVSSWETSNYVPTGQSWSGSVAYGDGCTGCDWLCDCGTAGWGVTNMQATYSGDAV